MSTKQGSAGLPDCQDRSAKADGPTMSSIYEADTFEGMRNVRTFRKPVAAAIDCVQQRAVGAGSPAVANSTPVSPKTQPFAGSEKITRSNRAFESKPSR